MRRAIRFLGTVSLQRAKPPRVRATVQFSTQHRTDPARAPCGASPAVTITETAGHDAETTNHDAPKCAVTLDRNGRSRCRNGRSRWAEIPISDLEILADILVCIDHNKADTTSSISYDEDGVRTSLNIFEKKSVFASIFSSAEKGQFITTLPLANVVGYVAENTSVTFKLNDGRLLMYGIRSTVTDSNFEVIYKANLVDFYG